MKKTLLITSMIMGGGVFGATAYAASNVTLYGVLDTSAVFTHNGRSQRISECC